MRISICGKAGFVCMRGVNAGLRSGVPSAGMGSGTMTGREIEVASFAALDPAGLHPVEVGGEAILLVRDGDMVHAVGGTCPHAGAPLAEGIRDGRRILCPWHKAAFCARTGAMLEPPALDDLPTYRTRIEGGRVFLQTPAQAHAAPAETEDARHFVIVGAGAAGATAAQTLRRAGFGGRITMLDRPNRVPYDRTILSKYALSGENGAEKTPLQSQAFYRRQRIERATAEVVRLDAASRLITCADGTRLQYDAALLATGSVPKPPSIPGAHLANVFTLRSREDAEAIVAQAERSARAVVLGASFIGMEVAASLRERGLDVVVVGQEATPFEKQLGPAVGSAFVALHERRGVRFRLASAVSGLDGRRAVAEVVLHSGERLPADLVVAGHGVAPATGFLEGVALDKDGGITVDVQLRAADGLFAAGDVARFPLYGAGPPARVEHWRVAQQQGRTAALNMLGKAVRFNSVPVFWTIQYMKRLDYIGHASVWEDVVLHGDPLRQDFLAYYVGDGRVLAAAGMGRDRDTTALMALFGRRQDWTPGALGEHPACLV